MGKGKNKHKNGGQGSKQEDDPILVNLGTKVGPASVAGSATIN